MKTLNAEYVPYIRVTEIKTHERRLLFLNYFYDWPSWPETLNHSYLLETFCSVFIFCGDLSRRFIDIHKLRDCWRNYSINYCDVFCLPTSIYWLQASQVLFWGNRRFCVCLFKFTPLIWTGVSFEFTKFEYFSFNLGKLRRARYFVAEIINITCLRSIRKFPATL